MGTIILILLVLWIAFAVLGFVIKGLFWLAVIGIVLFLATGLFGFLKNKSRT
jgi:hypothetical protein